MILDEVWGYDEEVSTNVVEVYIRYLKKSFTNHHTTNYTSK